MAAADTKAVRQALYSKLAGDSSITSRLATSTSIYHLLAPTNTAYPFIVFNKQAGTPSYTFGATALDVQVWQVKVVTRDSTSNTAEDIAKAIDALLTNGSLSLSTGSLMDLRRQSDVDYLEVEDGQQFRHHGGLYRITVQ